MLVQSDSNAHSALWAKCIRSAESKGLKPIPEIQIGLAIITMNTSIHCNPAAKRQVLAVKGQSTAGTYADSNSHALLAPETQFGKAQKRITQVSTAPATPS